MRDRATPERHHARRPSASHDGAGRRPRRIPCGDGRAGHPHASTSRPRSAARSIAALILAPESITAIKAALANKLQRSINLCLGSALSTVALTVPLVLMIGLATGQSVTLGLEDENILLLALTLMVSMLTFGGARTNVLHGAVHLLLFFTYLVLIFNP